MEINIFIFGRTFVVLVFGHCEERLHGVHGRGCAIQGRFGNVIDVHCARVEGPEYPDGFGLCQPTDINTLKFGQPGVDPQSIEIDLHSCLEVHSD
jgi:hypothetical protein